MIVREKNEALCREREEALCRIRDREKKKAIFRALIELKVPPGESAQMAIVYSVLVVPVLTSSCNLQLTTYL